MLSSDPKRNRERLDPKWRYTNPKWRVLTPTIDSTVNISCQCLSRVNHPTLSSTYYYSCRQKPITPCYSKHILVPVKSLIQGILKFLLSKEVAMSAFIMQRSIDPVSCDKGKVEIGSSVNLILEFMSLFH